MDSPLRTHTWQASSWFRKHRWGSSKRPCPSCLLEKHFSSPRSSSSSSSVYRRREAEPGSGAATLSTAVFYSPCLQVDRFQIVRDQGLVQKERCGNSHSDDGWGPHWDRRLAPSRLVISVQCGSPSTLLRSAADNCRGDVGAEGRELATRRGQSQPLLRYPRVLSLFWMQRGEVSCRWTQVYSPKWVVLGLLYIYI